MADVFSTKKRSQIMANIKSKNTGLETSFLKLLSREVYPRGIRYRKHYKNLPGSPDIVFISKKLAVFLDGNFWHGYNFAKTKKRLPKKYWLKKIENNIKRDKIVNKQLRRSGWDVIRIWEHEIRKQPHNSVKKIIKKLNYGHTSV